MKNKLLGIDYGDKRVGLALAEEGGSAFPYKVLANTESLLVDIKKIIEEEEISVVVVGLPHSLSGNNNQRLEISQNFVDVLKNHLKIKVATVDEQMTSKLYERMGVTKDIDKHAATAILDTYLANNG